MTVEGIEKDTALTTSVPVWTHVVLHHTASSIFKTVEQIRQEHLAKGWIDIGYNYLVDDKGIVHVGRPLNIPGAHALGWNAKAIGVAAIGCFDSLKMSKSQEYMLVDLVRRLMDEHGIPSGNVLYHKDVNATACPGANFPDIKAALQVPFRDVPPEHWARDAVAVAKGAGIMGGYPDGTFRGDNPVTRYEQAAVIAKLLKRMDK